MGLDTIAEGVDRFEAYLTGLTSVIGGMRVGRLRCTITVWGFWRRMAARA
jgi:hypothetical protein